MKATDIFSNRKEASITIHNHDGSTQTIQLKGERALRALMDDIRYHLNSKIPSIPIPCCEVSLGPPEPCMLGASKNVQIVVYKPRICPKCLSELRPQDLNFCGMCLEF